MLHWAMWGEEAKGSLSQAKSGLAVGGGPLVLPGGLCCRPFLPLPPSALVSGLRQGQGSHSTEKRRSRSVLKRQSRSAMIYCTGTSHVAQVCTGMQPIYLQLELY